MELTQKYTTIVHKEDDWHVSWFPDLDIASQGKTVEEALELYLEDKEVPLS